MIKFRQDTDAVLKSDINKDWQTKIAVKITAIVLWVVIAVSFGISVFISNRYHRLLPARLDGQANQMTYEIARALSNSDLANSPQTKKSLDKVFTRFDFSAVDVMFADQQISLGKKVPGLISDNRPSNFLSKKNQQQYKLTVTTYLPPIDEIVARKRAELLGQIWLGIIAFAIFLIIMIQKIVAKPFEILVNATKEVANGNMSIRVPMERKDEFGVLARFFNEMLDYVGDQQDKLKAEVQKYRDSQEALLIAMDKAEAANNQFKAAQSQLVQSEKMASLGAMISGIGHEINNPCNFIINNLHGLNKSFEKLNEIINEILSGDPEGERVAAFLNPHFSKSQESISLIQEGADRIANIVTSLRTFARSEGSLQDVDLNDVIKSTLRIMNHLLAKVDFKEEYSDISLIECSPARLGQVIMNIVANGIYAAEKSGRRPILSLKTYQTSEWINVEIFDNGSGIPPEAQKNIFDPFYTTKPVGEGTGLGLSISFNIMKEHGGILDFQTSSNGTTFFMRLPTKPKG